MGLLKNKQIEREREIAARKLRAKVNSGQATHTKREKSIYIQKNIGKQLPYNLHNGGSWFTPTR